MYQPNIASIGTINLKEILRPKESGEPVISHVFRHVSEPVQNFEEMRRVILGIAGAAKNEAGDDSERR